MKAAKKKKAPAPQTIPAAHRPHYVALGSLTDITESMSVHIHRVHAEAVAIECSDDDERDGRSEAVANVKKSLAEMRDMLASLHASIEAVAGLGKSA